MVDAPERIWATGSFDRSRYAVGSWNATKLTNTRTDYGEVEYVRADLYEQVKRERDNAQKLADSNYANICTQHRQIEDLTTRAEAAERLAGARVNVDTLRLLLSHFERLEELPSGEHPHYPSGVRPWGTGDVRQIANELRCALSALAEPAGEVEPCECGGDVLEDATTCVECGREKEWGGGGPAGEVEPSQFLPTEDGEFNGNTTETPIAADENREVDWVDVTGWGVFKGHAIPVDVARYIATKINLYAEQRTTPPDVSAIRETLELCKEAFRLIEGNGIECIPDTEAQEAVKSAIAALAGAKP